MTAELDLSLVPPLGEPRVQPAPVAHETTLPNGLHVVVVPRPGVPLIELRLRVPFAAPTIRGAGVHTARASVLSGAVLLGTGGPRPDRHRRAAAGARRRAVGLLRPRPAAVLHDHAPGGLAPVLGVLAELLTGATYPDDRVEGERERVAERIGIARSQPGVIARTALAARRYGSHPYAIELPDPDLVHGRRGPPRCAGCTASGSCPPAARSSWSATSTRARPPTRSPRRSRAGSATGQAVEAPPAPELGPPGIELVDRPGAVQSNLRLGGPAPGRTDPDLAARPAGQHGLRRLLLLAAGREHPRAARLHLQPAQLGRPPGGRVRRSSSRPTSPPRSPARRCWRPGTSSAAWRSPR